MLAAEATIPCLEPRSRLRAALQSWSILTEIPDGGPERDDFGTHDAQIAKFNEFLTFLLSEEAFTLVQKCDTMGLTRTPKIGL